MTSRRLTLQQIHAMSPAQRAERVAELLASAVARRIQRQNAEDILNIKNESASREAGSADVERTKAA